MSAGYLRRLERLELCTDPIEIGGQLTCYLLSALAREQFHGIEGLRALLSLEGLHIPEEVSPRVVNKKTVLLAFEVFVPSFLYQCICYSLQSSPFR